MGIVINDIAPSEPDRCACWLIVPPGSIHSIAD